MQSIDDGSSLLVSDGVGELLTAAVEHAGGVLTDWSLEHIDANPGQSTTATYLARVTWPHGVRNELIGVSARAGGVTDADERARIFGDGDREVAVWIYPDDPDLPGLARAAYPERMAELLTRTNLVGVRLGPEDLELTMIGYRPRRRAVVKVTVHDPHRVFYVKVLRPKPFADIHARHQLLLAARLPAPPVALTTDDHLLVLDELPGRPLAAAIFDPVPPVSGEALIDLLDAMPMSVAALDRRPPWSDAVGHYATMISHALPDQGRRLAWLSEVITSGLSHYPPGNEPTHGDFHEGQVHVMGGRICGILDIDTIGPGRRADDLACVVAHLSTVQRMSPEQTARVHHLIRTWVPVFDQRVDPIELRLRAAAVIISLATGPYRGQEPDWRSETVSMIDAAEALVRQVL